MSWIPPRIISVKVAYLRQNTSAHNLCEWMTDSNNVYIGRQGVVFIEINGRKQRYPPHSSKWANPYKVGKDGTREEVITKYWYHLRDQYIQGIISYDDILSLSGKTLGCWCKPELCHGDAIIDFASQLFTSHH